MTYCSTNAQVSERDKVQSITFFPRITAPGSPWITMYLVPPRNSPVGARVPGSAKSFIMPVISSGVNCNSNDNAYNKKLKQNQKNQIEAYKQPSCTTLHTSNDESTLQMRSTFMHIKSRASPNHNTITQHHDSCEIGNRVTLTHKE